MSTAPRSEQMTKRLMCAPEEARQILNADEIALFCGVPIRQVLAWIDAGLLKATPADDGRYRITAADFGAFVGRSDILIHAASGE